MEKRHLPIEQTEMFKIFESVSDWCWKTTIGWDERRWRVVGDQLCRAIAGVNANLVEGDGRGTDADALRFFVMARASAREARLWLQRVDKWCGADSESVGNQIELLTQGTCYLNNFIRYRRAVKNSVREAVAPYLLDPFAEDLDASKP